MTTEPKRGFGPLPCTVAGCKEPRVYGPFGHCKEHQTPLEQKYQAQHDAEMKAVKL